MEISVERAGLLTTVQDLGRSGHRAAGVPLAGAMDRWAARVANLLVGNQETAPLLELTLNGPQLVFSDAGWMAIAGATFVGAPSWRTIHVQAGERMKLGAAEKGCRGYLAIAGGFAIEPVLGSASTDLRSGFGGYEARALRDGDLIRTHSAARTVVGRWWMDERILPRYSASPEVRVIRGAQVEEFDGSWLNSEFKVTPRSNRMGLRLTGAKLERKVGDDLISAAVAPGTIQVPADGQPIVLMADAQTMGGYPQLAHVISVDLPLVAQLRPGDTIRFRVVEIGEAQRLIGTRERVLGLLREGLAEKIR